MNHDQKIAIALKKAQTHLKKVLNMVEDNEYCIDILQQNLAVIGLLKSANNQLLQRHLKSCFTNAMSGTDERQKQRMIEEVVQINHHLN